MSRLEKSSYDSIKLRKKSDKNPDDDSVLVCCRRPILNAM